MVGARVRRPQVAYARARGLSGRRACALLSVARSTLGYQSRLVDRDAPALAAMRRLAAQYPRYGCRWRITNNALKEGLLEKRKRVLDQPDCCYSFGPRCAVASWSTQSSSS